MRLALLALLLLAQPTLATAADDLSAPKGEASKAGIPAELRARLKAELKAQMLAEAQGTKSAAAAAEDCPAEAPAPPS